MSDIRGMISRNVIGTLLGGGVVSMALHRDVVTDGLIDELAWVTAYEAGAPVGFCHVDNGLLLVLPGRSRSGRLTAWEWIGDVRHFGARCVRCHREVSAPNGRVLQRARQDA